MHKRVTIMDLQPICTDEIELDRMAGSKMKRKKYLRMCTIGENVCNSEKGFIKI